VNKVIRLVSVALLLLACQGLWSGAPTAWAQAGSAAARPSPSPQASTNGGAGQTAATAAPAPLDIRARATERAIDASIPDDPAVKEAIEPYTAKVRELDAPIGKLEGELKRTGMGGGALGNFVADALRKRAEAKLGQPVLLAVLNSSGLRKSEIAQGSISTTDIYELLPFENALVALDLTGEQLLRFLQLTVERRNAQSGARIVYRTNAEKKNEVVSAKLRVGNDEKDIDPKATYTIVTIDYLVKRGGDYAVLQEAKNVRQLGLTMRDAVIDYVKAETAAGRSIKGMLDGRFKFERSGGGAGAEDNR
jgi:2',3'-cyclic-nucleotide 2'-phosphodiesterase (5'-nucleotidase family)